MSQYLDYVELRSGTLIVVVPLLIFAIDTVSKLRELLPTWYSGLQQKCVDMRPQAQCLIRTNGAQQFLLCTHALFRWCWKQQSSVRSAPARSGPCVLDSRVYVTNENRPARSSECQKN